uniref:Uncharacterized protein n=1 Tax=viral metagenome TaxID=1070528 RepID=A0A6C0BK45_9ZZZZ
MEADMFNIIISLGILLVSISFAFCAKIRDAERIVPIPEDHGIPEEDRVLASAEDEDTDEAETDDTDDKSDSEAVDAEAVDAEALEAVPPALEAVPPALEAVPPALEAVPGGGGPEGEEMAKPELDYLKAQLAFYRGEKEVCEAKMRNPTITLDNYELLKKHWDGLTAMITGVEEVIA